MTVESCCLVSSIAAVIGAWLGAFPIPLDWDRPWQVVALIHVIRAVEIDYYH